MSRPSLRSERRQQLSTAFARVLAAHGQEGASIAAVANEAGVAPGLVHHHFADKQDLYGALLEQLSAGFRERVASRGARQSAEPIDDYLDGALALDESSDFVAARAWVGLFAQAISDPLLFKQLRRLLDREVAALERIGRGSLSAQDASALLAFIVGSLVFGAFAPRKAVGFAAPAAKKLKRALSNR
jgi:TetR/AcrR family transcriptional repressor of bet genes